MDYRQAVLAVLDGEEEQLVRIPSGVEKRVRAGGGSRTSTPYGPQDVLAEDHIEHRREYHVKQYFHEVLHHLAEADRIYVFGPGEAKGEFVKELEKTPALGKKFVGADRTDKMTNRQVLAKTRTFYQSSGQR
jgi:hypothetical protein